MKKKCICLLCILSLFLSYGPFALIAKAEGEIEYISAFDFLTARSGGQPVYLYAESLNNTLSYDGFAYDSNTKTYNIMLADGKQGSKLLDSNLFPKVTPTEAREDLYGKITTADSEDPITQAAEKQFTKAINWASGGIFGAGANTSNTPQMADANPTVRRLIMGIKVDGEYTDTEIITFNFYRKATLESFAVAYENEDASPEGIPATFDPYQLNYEVTGVTPGKKLVITAPAYTQEDTVLKFDGGTGNYVAGSTATTFTLDPAAYENSSCKQADGSLLIPFKLEYTGNGCGVDGCYTLSVKFAETAPEEPRDSTITPSEVAFDKNTESSGYKDIPVTLTLNDNTFSGIWNGEAQLPVEAYTVEGTTVTLLKTWLAGLSVGDVTLTFKFSAGADQSLTLTVSDSTQTAVVNGFVKNIAFETNINGWEFFNQFSQNQREYDVTPIPKLAVGDTNAFTTYYNVRLELSDSENYNDYQYTMTVESLDGEILRSPLPRRFNSSTILDVSEERQVVNGKLQAILDNLSVGEYIFRISVFKADMPESVDEYVFHLTFVPVFVNILAVADGKYLSVTPELKQYTEDTHILIPDSYFIRDIEINANGETVILLKSTQKETFYPQDAVVVYEGEDRTADFVGNGITINLNDFEAENGVFLVPITVIYNATDNTRSDYILHIIAGEKAEWTITSQPQGGTFDKGDCISLSVSTDASEGQVTYQWQSSRQRRAFENGGTSIVSITGATNPVFEAPSVIGGTMYYRCVVTDTTTHALEYSDVVSVTVDYGTVNAPLIQYQPGIYVSFADMSAYNTEYIEGQAIDPLLIMAGSPETNNSGTGFARIEVIWYYNTQPSIQNAVLMDSKDYLEVYQGSYQIDDVGNLAYVKGYGYSPSALLSVGEHYFYCVVTAVSQTDETNRASTFSNFVKITVSARGELEGFDGKGTEAEPYLLKTVEDLERIRSHVLSGDFLPGAVFKFANDITLPLDWEPIGKRGIANGPDSMVFSGIIDGNNHTLFVEKGGRPLFKLTRDAIVMNLNIYGEEINGAGLVDDVIIDYGLDGVYQENDPDVITLENVTLLSGSKTKGSGLVNGGFNSGINDIFIKNCTIQEGVVVGYTKDQNKIGSFVGMFNGCVENSVSYATIYGTNQVGGIVGVKAQSMGNCEIINSAFLGTIEATSSRIGGIIGAGYIDGTAPNTPAVTVRNCYVCATIIGNSAYGGIGGIFGSEIGLQAPWNNAFISDNFFYGTITDTNPDAEAKYTHVGGILGELCTYDPEYLHYENNYYLKNDEYFGFGYLQNQNADWNPERDSFISKVTTDFADGTVTALLNQGAYKNWIQGEDGYPVHTDAVIPLELTISGNYNPDYYIGDTLDMSEAVFTITYSDGSEEIVDWTDVEFSGFDMSVQGVYTVTATWGPLSTNFEIRVLLKNPDAITVSFVLYGDAAHGDNGEIHTLDESNLTVWIARADYEINENTTVLDVFTQAATKAGFTWVNDKGNYISSITNGDITLEEFTNGPNSGWMYTLNGVHPKNSIAEQFLTDGDCILFHYTDDYTVETGMTDIAIRIMEMDTEVLTVKAGETAKLGVSFEPSLLNGNVRIDWTSADTGIATVKNGVVTGLSEGETTIIAEAKDAGFRVTATVTVTPGDNVVQVESVTVSPETLTLTEGETGTLTATVLPDNATSKDVQWSSSDETVATVSSKGVVTAVKAGTADITATAGGKSATVTITVEAEEIAVTGVTLNKTSVSVTEEETVTLKATVAPSNATNKIVTWLSSDEDVATVDENGVVTGVSAGTATITAQVGTYSATCEVTVTAADKTVKNLNIVDDDNPDNFARVTSSVETVVDGEGNKTKTAALTVDSTWINDEGEVEDIPCMVIVKNPDGSYERLEAKANPDGSYTFIKENYTEDMEFFVAVMGDTNLDGKLSIADMLLARAALLGKASLDDLAFMVSDLDGVNGLTITDILKARAYSLNMTTLDW